MRRYCLMILLPVLAACKVEPEPEPDPWEAADPVVLQSETDRKVLLGGNAGRGDFKANFGDPFIVFENRGSRMGISRPGYQSGYEVIDVAQSSEGGATVFRGRSDLVFPDESFVLTIVNRECTNPLSGEKTYFMAWLGPASAPRQTSTCAARAQ